MLRASGAISVDGRLDEPAWQRAFELPLVDAMDGSPPRRSTVARLLWDDRYLYVAFEAEGGEGSARPSRGDGGPAREEEAVALLVDATGTGRGFVEVEVSADNAHADTRFEPGPGDLAEARAWVSGARTATQFHRGAPGEGGFTVEMAVPLLSLRGSGPLPRPGDRWRANLYRIEVDGREGSRKGQAFSPPLRGDLHVLDRLGWLVFDGGALPPVASRTP